MPILLVRCVNWSVRVSGESSTSPGVVFTTAASTVGLFVRESAPSVVYVDHPIELSSFDERSNRGSETCCAATWHSCSMGDETEHQATVSMPEARRIDTDPPVRISARDIPAQHRQWPSKMLRCAHRDARVQAIDSAPKEQSRARRPYFRRTPEPGGRNRHATNCFYNVDERIRVIRAESDDSLVRDRSAKGVRATGWCCPRRSVPQIRSAPVVAENRWSLSG